MRSNLIGRGSAIDLGSRGELTGPSGAAGRYQAASRMPWPAATGSGVPGRALASAGLLPVVLTGAWLVADVLQPAAYSPVRDTVSGLAGLAGTDRWLMTGALFVVGGCYLMTAVSLTGLRGPARIVLMISAVCSAGIAASLEPPAGPTPAHLAWAALGAFSITVWPAFTACRGARPRILGVPGAVGVTVAFAALLGWVLAETQGGADLGLAERLTGSIQTCWPFVVAVQLRRAGRRRSAYRANR